MNLKNCKVIGIAMLSLMIIFTSCTASSEEINVEEQLSLGQKYLAELDYEKAIVAFQKVIEVDPKNIEAYLGLATAYEKTDRNEEAIQALEKVVEIEPENSEAYIRIADIYIKINNIEKAIEILKEAFEKTKNELIKARLDELSVETNSEASNDSNGVNSDINLEFEINQNIDISNGFNIEVLDNKTAILYLKDEELKPAYTVRQNEPYEDEDGSTPIEHMWYVNFEYANKGFEVVTDSSDYYEAKKDVSIENMSHALWVEDTSEEDFEQGITSYSRLCEVGFKLSNNIIAWKVVVPDEIDINFNNINDYSVGITHEMPSEDLDSTEDYYNNIDYYRDDAGNISVVN